MAVEEPHFQKGARPEQVVHAAFVAQVNELLTAASEVEGHFILERFGLDIAVFFRCNNQARIRLFEVKAFVGSRGSGVGFGTQRGEGPQVDLLMQDHARLRVADDLCAWLVADGTQPHGEPRFALVTNTQVKEAAMAGVARGKQNNINMARLRPYCMTWKALSDAVEHLLRS